MMKGMNSKETLGIRFAQLRFPNLRNWKWIFKLLNSFPPIVSLYSLLFIAIPREIFIIGMIDFFVGVKVSEEEHLG